jgi:hypothetical protein
MGHHRQRQTHSDLQLLTTRAVIERAAARLRRAPIMDAYAAALGRQLMATLAGVLDEVALHLGHLNDDEDAVLGAAVVEHCRELLLRPRPGGATENLLIDGVVDGAPLIQPGMDSFGVNNRAAGRDDQIGGARWASGTILRRGDSAYGSRAASARHRLGRRQVAGHSQ